MSTIAFIGLGNMGGPMAENLLKAGLSVRVFDLNTQAAKKLEPLGGCVGEQRWHHTGCNAD